MSKRIDIIGQKFNRLTVIKYDHTKKPQGIVYYLCKCDCGKDKIVSTSRLKSGHVKSCGCLQKDQAKLKIIDIIGQKFNRLTVIRFDHIKIPRGTRMYLCKCDCGKETFVSSHSLRKGGIKSCGCAATDFEPIIASARMVWRDLYWELTFDEFYNLSQQNCFYCGDEPRNLHTLKHCPKRPQESIDRSYFYYNGLDRVDNNLSHILNNVVPCCAICNKAKKNRTLNEFNDHIDNLLKTNKIDMVEYNYPHNLIDTTFLLDKENRSLKSSIKKKFRYYSDGDLTLEQFYQLSQMNCYYCSIPKFLIFNNAGKNSSERAKITGNFIYNGLDAVNNNLEHNYNNVVPCCQDCNYAKRDMNLEKFYDWIERLKNKRDQTDPDFYRYN